jgi:UDP-glucose 4-epimerase
MKIFVTGAAGYIGSHTVLELLNSGHDVIAFDNLSNSDIISLERVQKITGKSLEFIYGDVRNTEKLINILERFTPDIVMHFAALKSVSESMDNPIDYYDVNVNGSISLLKAMTKVKCNKFIFSSSATVYGTANYLPFDEKHPINPINPYGRSKLIVEQILQDWAASDEANKAVCLRYFNPVGAHQSGLIGENPRGIPNNLLPFIAQVSCGKRPYLNIYGDDYDTRDGTGERDYIHVVDLAICHLKAAEKILSFDDFQVLNLGTGRGTTVKELVLAFEKASNKKIPIKLQERRSGDVSHCWANPALSRRMLDYLCERTIEDVCRDAWLWQKKNPDGY